MNEFLIFFKRIRDTYGFCLEIYNSSIIDWHIRVGYKVTVGNNDTVIEVQHCDMEYAFAKAHVELKEWLSENKGGY